MGVKRVHFLIGHKGRIGLIAAFSLSAIASGRTQGTAEQREACTPDAVRLCSSEIPDVDRVTACMAAKVASLSLRCRAVFQTASDRPAPPPQQHRDRGTVRTYARHHEPHALGRYAHNDQPYAPHYRASVPAEEAKSIPRHRVWMLSEEAVGIERERACSSGHVPPEVCNRSGEYPPFPPQYPTSGEYPPYLTSGEYPPFPPPYATPMDSYYLAPPEFPPAREDFGVEVLPEEDDPGAYGE
jgi:hypothetical protein